MRKKKQSCFLLKVKFLSQSKTSLLLQEEDCQENYIKNCFIEYGQTAQNVTVTVCRTPLVKDCDKPGEEVLNLQISDTKDIFLSFSRFAPLSMRASASLSRKTPGVLFDLSYIQLIA